MSGDSGNAPTAATFAAEVDALLDGLVGDLVPRLSATESVLKPLLDPANHAVLVAADGRLRAQIERVTALRETFDRHRHRSADTAALHRAVTELRGALDTVTAGLAATRAELARHLGPEKLAEVERQIAEVARDERGRTILIDRPEVAPTVAVVLRSAPGVRVAYPVTLAEVDSGAAAARRRLGTTEPGRHRPSGPVRW